MIQPWYKQKFHKALRKGSRKGHGIHSPFMFDFITNVIENPHPFYAFNHIKDSLYSLLNSKEAIETTGWGIDFYLKDDIYTLGQVAHRTELDQKSGELLFRMINKFKCRNIVHYGPTLGNNLLYLGLSDTRNKIYHIHQLKDFNNSVEPILSENKTLDIKSDYTPEKKEIEFALINFPGSAEKTSKAVLEILPFLKEGAVLVVRGVQSSKTLKDWWNNFKLQQKTGITLDLNIIGLYFFRPDLQNQHFIY